MFSSCASLHVCVYVCARNCEHVSIHMFARTHMCNFCYATTASFLDLQIVRRQYSSISEHGTTLQFIIHIFPTIFKYGFWQRRSIFIYSMPEANSPNMGHIKVKFLSKHSQLNSDILHYSVSTQINVKLIVGPFFPF